MALADYSLDYLQQQIADAAAQTAYHNALAAGATEDAATRKAAEAWQEKYQAADLTGTFNGQPTWAVDQALGASPSGSPLLNQQAMYGNAAGSAGGGTPTEDARQFNVNSSGYLANGNPTLAREENQNQTSLGYLGILKDLQGPSNFLQYSRVLNGTPDGLRDVINASAGRYVLPTSGGGATPVYTGQGSGIVQPRSGAVNPDGSLNASAFAGVPYTGPASTGGSASNGGVPMGQQTLSGLVGAANNPAPYTPTAADMGGGLANPNQIDIRNYSRMAPSDKAMLLATYQDQGWNPDDVKAAINAAAPAYTGPTRGAYGSLFSA